MRVANKIKDRVSSRLRPLEKEKNLSDCGDYETIYKKAKQ